MKRSQFESLLIQQMKRIIARENMDNISRTKFYESFYGQYPEITWSLLAGIVSRNAGWHMCDLEGMVLSRILTPKYRRNLFLFLERANWLIFQDACPQLLLYHYSTLWDTPLFHLLRFFSVSSFMQEEWQRFWNERDEERLLYALIINEQNVIQKPIIEDPINQEIVLQSLPYRFQERFSYSYVLLPAANGALFGFPIKNFSSVNERIELGKRLATILFTPQLYEQLYIFVKTVEPTGSRWDYERFLPLPSRRKTRPLRLIYPVIHHKPVSERTWDVTVPVQNKWFQKPVIKTIRPVTDHFMIKQKEIEYLSLLKTLLG